VRIAAITVCVISLAGIGLAAKLEKRAQELWQKTPLLLKECSVTSSAVFVDANGQISSGTQGPSQDFCLLSFSSVQQTDDWLVLSGKVTRLKAEGADLVLKVLDEKEPFQISIDCPKKSANEEGLYSLDKALFSHAALEPNKAVPQYFLRIVNQYLGIEPSGPVKPVGVATASNQAGVVYPPKTKYDPEPAYSNEAKSRHIEGTTKVLMIVDKDGHTKDPQVLNPLGFGLDEEAVKTVRTWTFEPARKDKSPVAVMISVEVNFHLY
jgi:TonB family protein